jgi:hypothetical protein
MRWTRSLRGTALAAAAALAAVGCTSAPVTSTAGTTPGTAVTAAEAASAYGRIVPLVLAAGSSADVTAALSSTTDVAHVEVSTSHLTASYFNERLPAGDLVRLGTPAFYLPDSAGYPQWFVADAAITSKATSPPSGEKRTRTPRAPRAPRAPGGIRSENANGQIVFLFTKASVTAPWQLSSMSELARGTSLPALAVEGNGLVRTVSMADTTLLAQPNVTGPLQAGVVDDGPANAASKVVASGPLTTGIYDSERARLFGLTAPHGDILQWQLEGSNFQQFALRTADGGALVFYAMYLNTVVQTPGSLNQNRPLNPGPAISVSQLLAPLLGRGHPTPRIKLEGQQLLSFAAVDPPASGGKIRVIAIGGGWSYAYAS